MLMDASASTVSTNGSMTTATVPEIASPLAAAAARAWDRARAQMPFYAALNTDDIDRDVRRNDAQRDDFQVQQDEISEMKRENKRLRRELREARLAFARAEADARTWKRRFLAVAGRRLPRDATIIRLE